MDSKQTSTKRSFGWLPEHMPGVARLMAEKRREHGDAHVNECWRRGVIAGEAGWFFAREGTLSIGVLELGRSSPEFEGLHITATQALLVMKNPEGVSRGKD